MEAALAINLFEDGIDLITVGVMDWTYSVRFYFHRRAVEDHVIGGPGIVIDADDIEEHLNAVMKFRGGIAEKDFIRPIQPQGAVRFLLSVEVMSSRGPVIDDSGFSQRVSC